MLALHITTIQAGLGNLHKSISGRMVPYVGMCMLLIIIKLFNWKVLHCIETFNMLFESNTLCCMPLIL